MMTRRVFVLGSGFSAAMGLPTLVDLFSQVMKASPRHGWDDKRQVRDAIAGLYQNFRRDVQSPGYPPFEEFLSLVVAAKELGLAEDDWSQTETSAVRLLTDRVNEMSRKAIDSRLLERFARSLREEDVVITFNWDCLIERRLYKDGRRVDFVGSSDGVTLLKLHGSLGWFFSRDRPPGFPTGAIEFAEDVFYLNDHAYFDLWGVLHEGPFLIPPTYSKRFEGSPLMKSIWQHAHQCLADAERVYVIGYSMPPEDIHASALLRSGLRSRSQRLGSSAAGKCIVVDPNPAVGGKYFSLVAGAVDFRQMCFEAAADEVLTPPDASASD